MITKKLETLIREALKKMGIESSEIKLERPEDASHGDYATNVALACAKTQKIAPKQFAEKLVAELLNAPHEGIEKIEIAGPGFINFFFDDAYFSKSLEDALGAGDKWGTNATLKNKKVLVEYTDPNILKEFHIGHLMSNTIGESIACIMETTGAEVKRACYQGDVGMHVACAIWGIIDLKKDGSAEPMNSKFLGKAYARGATASKENENAKKEIIEINKKIYTRSDEKINKLYDLGRQVSLDDFEGKYKKLGMKTRLNGKSFDFYFFESKTWEFGKKIVLDNPKIFEKSDGAIIYKGDESKGLHTRVFINSEGIPTYEAKDLGLSKIKYETYPYEISIVVTANEQKEYFRVVLDAMAKVSPELAKKTEHYSHGMLRLPTGKMSSRTGDVVTAEALLRDVKGLAIGKIKDSNFSSEEKNDIAEKVALGAIKYSILRQSSGKDIIFDFEKSLSFEGDSGPYLQYSYARARSLLEKASGKKIDVTNYKEISPLHKYIVRFPEVVLRAGETRQSHYITTYLIDLAREFNSFYGNTLVLDGSPDEAYKLALVKATSQTLKNGLELLGIPVPERM
ncbi:MAG: arginine--tRNA ligase [Candidatus Pacebacteria bacterium]|nr:arginine--tRNA ligase [Candidatus Paceibacterota bacterium]